MSKSSTGRGKNNKTRERSPNPGLYQQLQAIVSRLNALEDNSRSGIATVVERQPAVESSGSAGSAVVPCVVLASEQSTTPPLVPTPVPRVSADDCVAAEVAGKIVSAINELNLVRPNHIYISNFDPDLNDINVWCDEVDHARVIYRWTDRECLSHIGNCLKGDARVWLNEWVTNDRSWSNFKREFKPLCPRRVDVANILFDVMKTDSNNYPTYAEYVRRSLLRLRIVNGLSDELVSAIVIRGIVDPQIRAAATNARLLPNDLVEFFSIYVKPTPQTKTNHNTRTVAGRFHNTQFSSRKREHSSSRTGCYVCGSFGHRQVNCPKRTRKRSPTVNDRFTSVPAASSSMQKPEPCSFCKKLGHKVEQCFFKQRSEARGKSNVNFCRDTVNDYRKNDIATAIVQGVPVDILIDSGSTVSLMSESIVKHFQCKRVPSFCVLRGIGDCDTESRYFTTLTVEFPEITLEIDFQIVSDKFMNTPVIIGTDVLNREGVTYIRKKGIQRLTRVEKVFTAETTELNSIPTVNTSLTGEEKNKLLALVRKFSKYLITGTAASTVTTGSMQIRLSNETPIVYRPYKLSFSEKLRVREIIKDLLDKGVIRESESEFSSPILLVKKKDGSDRMCVDFRALNANTVKDRYPLPLIDDHIDRLGSAKYFTSLDMATGFHQIPLANDSIHKTGFVTPEGHFEYLKMPYGLANAPVVYQRIITNTLKAFSETGRALIYIDDVLIPSQTIDEGLNTLREIFETLTKAGFSINLKKCKFLANEIEYLGRSISNGQVRPSAYKVEALTRAPKPGNVKQARQFLGLAGYFRRYIPAYSLQTACISNLFRKGVEFKWGDEQEQVRQYIITRLTSEPVLNIFNPSLLTEVHTDASSRGYGAVLLQTHGNNNKRVVGYFSKVTQGAEPRYHSYELETLAVVKALQHFRHYLIGIHFKVVTDCNALKLTQRKKDLLPRVARWWIYLQDYDFSLEYRKGAVLSHADYLSRNPINVCEIGRPHNWAQIAQSADEETRNLIQKLQNGELDETRYVTKNDVLYYKFDSVGQPSKLLCYIPRGHRLSLLRIFHDEHHHIGVDKTLDLILNHFWFPSLRQFVRKYVRHCIVCLSHKKIPRQPLQPIESWKKPDVPFDTVHSDVLGPLPESNGYKFVVLIIDAYSKFCLLNPMRKQDATELKLVFENAVSLFGAPRQIVTDRGRMYENRSFRQWVSDVGSNLFFITPEMHQSNGQAERYCRTVLNMIRVEVNFRNENWSEV